MIGDVLQGFMEGRRVAMGALGSGSVSGGSPRVAPGPGTNPGMVGNGDFPNAGFQTPSWLQGNVVNVPPGQTPPGTGIPGRSTFPPLLDPSKYRS